MGYFDYSFDFALDIYVHYYFKFLLNLIKSYFKFLLILKSYFKFLLILIKLRVIIENCT